MTRYGSHTESRMRENCTYGSMRGWAFPMGRLALLYTLFIIRELYLEAKVRFITGRPHKTEKSDSAQMFFVLE